MSLLRGHRRRTYTQGPTPLERLEGLETWLQTDARIWVKRDDKTGLALGGNKTRKLEFLMHDALVGDADCVITCGSVQSNHCRLTAAAAAVEGLQCHLVIREKKPDQYDPSASGNNLLYSLLGAELHVHPPGTDLDQAMGMLAAQLRRERKTPYVIPMGGSNALGALGYVACAEEILDQARQTGMEPSAVVCASSSGGTQAGLIVGLHGAGIPVHGISVDYDEPAQCTEVLGLMRLTAAAIGRDPPEDGAVIVDDRFVGPGYAEPTPEMVDAVRAFARHAGIVLDPVYTGKAAAGLLERIREGHYADSDVVFVHTGGSPALFAYPHPAVPEHA